MFQEVIYNCMEINVREIEGAINNGHFRHAGNIGHTRHRTKTNKTQHRKLER
jgi:hypothetical protein